MMKKGHGSSHRKSLQVVCVLLATATVILLEWITVPYLGVRHGHAISPSLNISSPNFLNMDNVDPSRHATHESHGPESTEALDGLLVGLEPNVAEASRLRNVEFKGAADATMPKMVESSSLASPLSHVAALPQADQPVPSRAEMLIAVVDLNTGFKNASDIQHGSCLGVSQVREIRYCPGLLTSADENSQHQMCVIYIFGVAKEDPFTAMMSSRPGPNRCQVFAFDPTVTDEDFGPGGAKGRFGNLEFRSWGLRGSTQEGWSGAEEWSHPLYGTLKGELFTLGEIQAKLGHGPETQIAYMRVDCEGCEWAWIAAALRQDASIFSRIQQMFLEIHFASTLRFDEAALARAPQLRSMIQENFLLGWTDWNLGMRVDRHKIQQELVDAGVNRKACCREYFFISRKL